MQNTQGEEQQLYFGPKKKASGVFIYQEGTLLHQVEGSVGEWVGPREESPDTRIRCHGSWKRKGANNILVDILEAESRKKLEGE